jgi:hypothetical protein
MEYRERNMHKKMELRAVSRLCVFYPDISVTTEDKARRNLH